MKFRNLVVTSILTFGLVVAPLSITTMPAFAAPAAGNTLAICGCGKVFTPTAKTQYMEHEGARYACCSDGCHAMAAKNPAKVAKMAKAKTATAIGSVQMPIHVANVFEVTTEGARAVCACGGATTVSNKTAYVKANGKTYAACSKQCSTHMSKDLAKTAAAIEAKLAEYRHTN